MFRSSEDVQARPGAAHLQPALFRLNLELNRLNRLNLLNLLELLDLLDLLDRENCQNCQHFLNL